MQGTTGGNLREVWRACAGSSTLFRLKSLFSGRRAPGLRHSKPLQCVKCSREPSMKPIGARVALSLIAMFCLTASLSAEERQVLPAFPGAEGFGAIAKGGRGGRV